MQLTGDANTRTTLSTLLLKTSEASSTYSTYSIIHAHIVHPAPSTLCFLRNSPRNLDALPSSFLFTSYSSGPTPPLPPPSLHNVPSHNSIPLNFLPLRQPSVTYHPPPPPPRSPIHLLHLLHPRHAVMLSLPSTQTAHPPHLSAFIEA